MLTNKNDCFDRIRICIRMIHWTIDKEQDDKDKLYYIQLWSEDIVRTIRTYGELSIEEGVENEK